MRMIRNNISLGSVNRMRLKQIGTVAWIVLSLSKSFITGTSITNSTQQHAKSSPSKVLSNITDVSPSENTPFSNSSHITPPESTTFSNSSDLPTSGTTNTSAYIVTTLPTKNVPLIYTPTDAARSAATTITLSEATSITPSEATSITPSEATSITRSEATSITSLEATSIIPSEATSIIPSEVTSITPSEATTITLSEATSITPSEATSITPSEATSISSSEANSIIPSEATSIIRSEASSIILSEINITTPEITYITVVKSASSETFPQTTDAAIKPTVPTEQPVITELNIPLELKYDNVTFQPELNDTNSKLYNETKTNYTMLLKSAYQQVSGFQNLIITNFREGSLYVDYTVVMSNVTLQKLIEQLVNLTPVLTVLGANETILTQSLNKSLKQAIRELNDGCPKASSKFCFKDYVCRPEQDGPICEPFCFDPDSRNKCQNGGSCVRDAPNSIICRCLADDKYVYGGQYCEVKVEKLALSKNSIIGIASGSGGGIILIFIIIIIVVCRWKNSKKQSRNNKNFDSTSEQSFKSIRDSEDGFHQAFTGLRNASPLDYNNPTFRLPEVRSENPSLRPHTSSMPVNSASVIDPLNISNHPVMKPNKQEVEIKKQNRSGNQMHQKMVALPISEYTEIDDNNSKSLMYQPTRVMRPLTEFHQGGRPHSSSQAVVYDYTRPAESGANSSHPDSGLNFYDFDYENNRDKKVRSHDPYSVSRPRVASQKQFANSSHPDSGLNFYDFDNENNLDKKSRSHDPYSVSRPRVASQKQF